MSVSAASNIWSSAASALTNAPSSKSAHAARPNEAGKAAQPMTLARSSTANPFQQLSSAVQSQLIQSQAG